MKLSNIFINALRLVQATFGIHLLGALLLFVVVFTIYALLLTTIWGMPVEGIVELSKTPERLTAYVNQPHFLIKFWFFCLLIDGIITPFTAGVYKNYAEVIAGSRPSFRNLFAYYHVRETNDILGHVILQMCLKTLVSVGAIAIGTAALGLALTTIISLVFVLTVPIIVLEGKSLFRAMGHSYQRIMRAPFTALIVTAFGMVCLLIGLFAFGIGVTVTYSYLLAGIFSIYQATSNNK